VTSLFLLRNTGLNVEQIQRLLNDFLEQNVTEERISSTFSLLGEVHPDYDHVDGIVRMKSTICRKEELEQTKQLFKVVDTCSICSVQAMPIRDYQSLFNVNWATDGNPYLSPTKNKTLIWNSVAHNNYVRWMDSRQDEAKRLDNVSKHMVQNEMMRNAAKLDDNKPKEKDVKKPTNFFKNAVKALPEKKSPVKSSASSPQMKRIRRILSDDEDEGDDEEKEEIPGFDSLEKEEKMEIDKQLPLNLLGSDTNDLYCTGGDSPVKQAEPMTEKEVKNFDEVAASRSNPQKSVLKPSYVANSKPKAKAAARNQPMISSFFTKK